MVDEMTSRNEVRVGRWLIYGILDPRFKKLIYVGKTHKRREIRLAEHIERACEGRMAPIYIRIREILLSGQTPQIFVLVRVPPNVSWQREEQNQIHHWRNIDLTSLPIIYLPQTKKSEIVEIRSAEILNVRDGG